MVALDPAPAQDRQRDRRHAARPPTKYGLRTISDLGTVAPGLTFGGPPECPTRPFCLKGLRETYGLQFESFLPLDAGGPLTRRRSSERPGRRRADVHHRPAIATDDLVELDDDRALQPAENVTPLVHRSAVDRFGAPMSSRSSTRCPAA